MKAGRVGWASVMLWLGAAVGLSAAEGADGKHPVYIGAEGCARCHGAGAGCQYGRWRITPHARAYTVLAAPESWAIAEISGVTGDPQKSRICLGCHVTSADAEDWERTETFKLEAGIQCETCHGPGSEYAEADVMRDRVKALARGLVLPDKTNSCWVCHRPKGSHEAILKWRPFDLAKAWADVAHPIVRAKSETEARSGANSREKNCRGCHDQARGYVFDYQKGGKPKASRSPPARPAAPLPYKTPLNLALSPDGKELWVVCEAANSVLIVDTATRRVMGEVAVGGKPTDVTFDPAGRRVFVSNRLDDSVSVVDAVGRKVIATLAAGNEPHGLLLDREGERLYVLNTSIDSISVFDTHTLTEVRRLAGSRSPWSLALSPDGRQILVTHELSRFVPRRTTSLSEVAVVDTASARITERRLVPSANLVQGVAWHPSGEYAVITLVRTKNLVPMTQLWRDWTISNGLGILWRDGRVDQVLLDEPGLCFPDPAAVAITPDGRYALVTSSSTDRVGVVDLARLIGMLRAASPREREHVFPNHLGKATEFVVKFIPTGVCPRGIRCAGDGSAAYVANSLDDSLTVINLPRLEPAAVIELGGPRDISEIRRGERLFNSAKNTFHREFSCHTCHPDGHIDGLTYDTEPDGIGLSPVDNRTLRGILDTAPFKWEGTNPSLRRQCGPRLAVFFTRIQPFTEEELTALEHYICTIPRPPNRYRKLGEPLTPAQRRGKEIFERTRANDGRAIPPLGRCITCHPPPLYTDGRVHDVGTRQSDDRQGKFDVPHLNNIYDSAPYLHNGMAETLEEIWTRYNLYDQHGVTNDMTKDQLNDLIEYLKTL